MAASTLHMQSVGQALTVRCREDSSSTEEGSVYAAELCRDVAYATAGLSQRAYSAKVFNCLCLDSTCVGIYLSDQGKRLELYPLVKHRHFVIF